MKVNNFAAIGVVRGPALAAVAGFRSGARIAGDRAMVRLPPIIFRSRTARGCSSRSTEDSPTSISPRELEVVTAILYSSLSTDG
jgi:hypothetical protein